METSIGSWGIQFGAQDMGFLVSDLLQNVVGSDGILFSHCVSECLDKKPVSDPLKGTKIMVFIFPNFSLNSAKSCSGKGAPRISFSLLPLFFLCMSFLWSYAPCIQAQTALAPTVGDGLTTATAYQITQLGHLVWLGERAAANETTGKYYQLMKNIDASDTANWNDAGTTTATLEGFRPIGVSAYPDSRPFLGTFEGNGKKITGLTINRSTSGAVGLFGYAGLSGDTSGGGRIRNLMLENSSIRGNMFTGNLVGMLEGKIRDCSSSGSVTGGYGVGGLVGTCSKGVITDCTATGSVTGSSNVGGLTGDNSASLLRNCSADGAVIGNLHVGGLVGEQSQGSIVNCYSRCFVKGYSITGGLLGYGDTCSISSSFASGAVTAFNGVGGLLGSAYQATVENCFATGAATGFEQVGGLVGSNGGQIACCFAVGRVTGTELVGGVVGSNDTTVTACYWDIETTGQAISAGSDVVSGKTTAKMKQSATFAGWNFTSVWGVAAGESYPYLRFSPPPFRLNVTTEGAGTVSVLPQGGVYAAGTEVALTAIPADAAVSFLDWMGVRGDAAAPSASVLMDTHRSVATHFRRHYEVRTLTELQAIASGDLDGHYTLMNDLDASDTANWNDAGTDLSAREGFRPIGSPNNSTITAFRGVFNGGGKKISGLMINRPNSTCVGLFGSMGLNAEVRDLVLDQGVVAGNGYVGILAGHIEGGKVQNCSVSGKVTGSEEVGGLAGFCSNGILENCSAAGTVRGLLCVGGLMGGSDRTRIRTSFSTAPAKGFWYVGGLMGSCYGNSSVQDSFATGPVTGDRLVGGLVGRHYGGTVQNSFAVGKVTGGQFVGGLVGTCPESTVTASYWDRETTGQTSSTGSPASFGKTTAEMKQMATFAGWNFTSVWGITEGQSYPYLRFTPPPFRLNVIVVGPGSVTLDPPGGAYAPGTPVTLTATPAAGSRFVEWTGLETSQTSLVVLMDASRSVMAHFRRNYEIRTLAELQAINTTGDSSGYFVLMNDIDASDTANWNDEGTTGAQGFRPIGLIPNAGLSDFRGIFEGNGRKITGLTINRPGEPYVGLFASIGQGGEVRNLTLEGGSVTGGWIAGFTFKDLQVGGLAGQNMGGKIENCRTALAVRGGNSAAGPNFYGGNGYNTGGLVGYCRYGLIGNCAATGPVIGGVYTGGLAGSCRNSSIWNCSASGFVTSEYTGGGLIGKSDTDSIWGCFATGMVTGTASSYYSDVLGGLIGTNGYGTLDNCFATGPVVGNAQKEFSVGGLIGNTNSGSITNCYATGATTPVGKDYFHSSGGLVGGGYLSTQFSSCYWDVETTGQASSKGGTGAVGKTTAEMKRQATFTGWDFATVWGIIENRTYPSFQSASSSFPLNVSVVGAGAVTLDPPGGVYTPGTTVTLTATPAAGYCFDRWLGGVSNPFSSTTQVVVDSPKSVGVRFRLNHEIRTLAELQAIATGDLTAYYTLMNDIDASETATWNDEGTDTYTLEGFRPIGWKSSASFVGIFNGNGKKITGLTLNRQWSETNVALFAQVGKGGEIRNLTLEGGSVTGYRYTGGLVGTLSGGLVNHCSVRMTVTGGSEHTGGLVGYNAGGTIEDCDAGGDVTGKGRSSTVGVGGLVGINSSGSIKRCSAGGTVKVTPNNSSNTGGLVGVNSSGTVTDCFANASVMEGYATGGLVGRNYSSGLIENCIAAGVVTQSYRDNKNTGGVTGANYGSAIRRCFNMGIVTGYDLTGGVAGYNGGEISDCFSNGPVKGRQAVGGLVGGNYSNRVTHCFASGSVQGTSDVGGLIGSSSVTSVTACYWDAQTTGQPTTTTITGAEGKTTAEMKKMATFSGWDFANVWGISENKSYPYLRWFPEPFELTLTLIQEGPGQVILDPPGGVYAPGTTVTLTAVPQSGGRFAGWIGDVADPLAKSISIYMDSPKSIIAYFGHVYEIRTLDELQAIAISGDMTGYYMLMNDLDASETANWNDEGTSTDTLEGFKPIGKYSGNWDGYTDFRGVFDGNGKKITGLTINRPQYISGNREGVGLFGLVGPEGEIKNLTFEGGHVRGYSNVGILVGVNEGTVSNSFTQGDVTGGYAGGLVGTNKGTVTQSSARGEVTSSYGTVGGLVGYNYRGAISRCFATGVIRGGQGVGGLVGLNYSGSISESFATGQVIGSGYTGGLLGENYSGSVSNCYACGEVTSKGETTSGIGGLIGSNSGTVSGGYWDVATTGWAVSGGSEASFGKTTAQMKRQATFTGWDFTNVWAIVEGVSYPYLRTGSGEIPFFSLNIETDGEGKVALSPVGELYVPGTTVTLMAVAAPGYRFWRWSGAVADSTTDTTTLVMDTCKSVTAHFRRSYEIRTLAELQAIAFSGDMTGYYILMNDIDASDTANWNDAGTSDLDVREGFRPIGSNRDWNSRVFTGVFDGNGKKISGLTINRPYGGYIGLFSVLAGEIRNLTLDNVRIEDSMHTIYFVGGLVGQNRSGCIENCSVSGLVNGGYDVGGLVGTNGEEGKATISQSFSTALVRGIGAVGGLVGYNNKGMISQCFSTGDTSCTVYFSDGGLAGANTGRIRDCFATGVAMGTSSTAGLVGQDSGGTIVNCFAVGRVTSPINSGGLLGASGANSSVTASYWDKETTGQTVSAGSDATFGKTTAQMKQQGTFAGWDFTSVWGIAEGQSYPYLRFMPPPFRLSVTVDGLGTFSRNPVGTPVTASGSATTYAAGTSVTLTAGQPGTESYFDGWIGGNGNPQTTSTSVLMDTHRSVTLQFALNEYPLTIEAENGTVWRSLDRITYPYGSVVTLTPLPNAGYRFLEWAGDVPTADVKKKPLMIQIRKATSVQARFGISHPALWMVR
jgi:hypothetical protein